MNRSIRRILIAVSVALFLIVNLVALRWSTAFFFSPHNSTLLRYGSKIPCLKGQSLTPLLQKYSPNGELLFESRLDGPEIERLKAAVQKKKYITSPVEGPADGRIIALDPVVDPTTGNILIPLVDGSIYIADSNGKRINFLRPLTSQPADQTFYPFVAGLGANGEFLVNPFPPKHWYRLIMPPTTKDGATIGIGK